MESAKGFHPAGNDSLRMTGSMPVPRKGHLKPEDEELRRLKRECERLRRERDILKKAVTIFSTDPHRYSGSEASTALFSVFWRCAESLRCLAVDITNG
ncbi:MAG: hypothetical protein WB792_12550 [Desulfobacterales bacterium]